MITVLQLIQAAECVSHLFAAEALLQRPSGRWCGDGDGVSFGPGTSGNRGSTYSACVEIYSFVMPGGYCGTGMDEANNPCCTIQVRTAPLRASKQARVATHQFCPFVCVVSASAGTAVPRCILRLRSRLRAPHSETDVKQEHVQTSSPLIMWLCTSGHMAGNRVIWQQRAVLVFGSVSTRSPDSGLLQHAAPACCGASTFPMERATIHKSTGLFRSWLCVRMPVMCAED